MDKKVCVITGASKGIGLACAQKFIENGYIVVSGSRSNENPINSPDFHFFKTDVAKEEDVKNLVAKTLENFGKIDVFINNAGFGLFANLADSTTEEFDSMFAVNVRGLYLCCRYAVKSMIEKQSGIIINIASIAGKSFVPTASIYCATKHAVMGLSGALFQEVRKHNVRVSVICPGSVDTHFFDAPGTILSSSRETILSAQDVAESCYLAASLPASANISEIELRPTNPRK
ncbi:MAG: SDR family oxidoreductase [Bacteroidetes bacterium]|nr:SDR family oxidoreductase [Bacteroidota bacterium]MBX7046172.1 SDR family oxidoreductase [Ignavibacteria bacterium]